MEDKITEAINLLFNKFPTTQAMYKHYIYYKLINITEGVFWVVFLLSIAIVFLVLWYIASTKADVYRDYYHDCTFGDTKRKLNDFENRIKWLEKKNKESE